jgi:hypothetical protein
MLKKDSSLYGFFLGLLFPCIGVFIFYLIKVKLHGGTFADFEGFFKTKQNIPKILVLGLIANMPLFYYFQIKRIDYTMKGIFIATCLIGMVILLYKFL